MISTILHRCNSRPATHGSHYPKILLRNRREQAISCAKRARDTVVQSLGRVAEWQTRWLQVPVSFGTWGFKSPFAHRGRAADRIRSAALLFRVRQAVCSAARSTETAWATAAFAALVSCMELTITKSW